MNVRMTAAACVVVALVAVPAAFADHGSGRGDDGATVTTLNGSQVAEPADATDQPGEAEDESTEAQQPGGDDRAESGGDDSSRAEEQTDASEAASTATDDVPAPSTVATFSSGHAAGDPAHRRHSSKSGHHRHEH